MLDIVKIGFLPEAAEFSYGACAAVVGFSAYTTFMLGRGESRFLYPEAGNEVRPQLRLRELSSR